MAAPTSSSTSESSSAPPGPRSAGRGPKDRWTRFFDLFFYGGAGLVGASILVLAVALVWVLAAAAHGSIARFGFGFLWGRIWDQNSPTGPFGVLPFVVGTLVTSALALLIAVPVGLGAAIFLTAHAPQWIRGPVSTAVELLAAIPSIIFGLWGLYVVHPYMAGVVEPSLQHYLGWTGLFGGQPIGLDLLTAGIVLSFMVVPTISAISREALAAVPVAQREAALSLGATEWESTRYAALPFARAGIFGGIILGLGRAIGETMALVLVIGGSDRMPTSLLSAGQTIATLIANELLSFQSPLQEQAILEAALVLLLISLLVNIVARLLVWRISGRARVSGT